MRKKFSKKQLEAAYRSYNHRCFVHPDPLEFIYKVNRDNREIVGFIAAVLAYGRVQQILKSVDDVLCRLEDPYRTVTFASEREISQRLRGFKHRFTTGREMARLLSGVGRLITEHGSLGNCFARHFNGNETVLDPLTHFVDEMTVASGGALPFLLASPRNGSACKRLNLYLRWMVRKDSVDPGGWEKVEKAALIVPLDAHMHRIGLTFGLTARKSGDMKTALEITDGFRRFRPDDPVRYDFALTRSGILRNWSGSKTEGMTK